MDNVSSFSDSAIDWLIVHDTQNRSRQNENSSSQRHASECAGLGGEVEVLVNKNNLQQTQRVCWFLLEPRNRILIEGNYGIVVASDGIVRDVAVIQDRAPLMSSNNINNNNNKPQQPYFFVCIAASDGTFIQRVAPGGQTTLLYSSTRDKAIGMVDLTGARNGDPHVAAILENGDAIIIDLSTYPCQVVQRAPANTTAARLTPGWIASTLSFVPKFGSQLRDAVTIQPVLDVASSAGSDRFVVLRRHSIQVWRSTASTCEIIAEHSLLFSDNPQSKQFLKQLQLQADPNQQQQQQQQDLPRHHNYTKIAISLDGQYVGAVREVTDDEDLAMEKEFDYECDIFFPSREVSSSLIHNAVDVFKLVEQDGIYERPYHLSHRSIFYIPIKNVQRVSIFSHATVVVSGSRRLCVGALRDSFVETTFDDDEDENNNNINNNNERTQRKIRRKKPMTCKLLFDKSIPHEFAFISQCRPTEVLSDIFQAVHPNDFKDDSGCFVRILDINFELRIDFLGLPAAVLRRFTRLITESSFFDHHFQQQQQNNNNNSNNATILDDERTAEFFRTLYGNCFKAYVVPNEEIFPRNHKEGEETVREDGSRSRSKATTNQDDSEQQQQPQNISDIKYDDHQDMFSLTSRMPTPCQLLLRALASLRVRRPEYPEKLVQKTESVEAVFAFFRTAILPTIVNQHQSGVQHHPVQNPRLRVNFSLAAAALKRELDRIEDFLVRESEQQQQNPSHHRNSNNNSNNNKNKKQQAFSFNCNNTSLLIPLANYLQELIRICSVDIGSHWFDPSAAAVTLESRIAGKDVNGAIIALRGPNDHFGIGDAVTVQAMFLNEVICNRARNLDECLTAVHALSVIARESSSPATTKRLIDSNMMNKMIHNNSTRALLPAYLRRILIEYQSANSVLPRKATQTLRELLSPAGNLELDVWELILKKELDRALESVCDNIVELYTLDHGEPLAPITARLAQEGRPEFAEIKIALSLVEKRPSSIGRERARARKLLISAIDQTARNLLHDESSKRLAAAESEDINSSVDDTASNYVQKQNRRVFGITSAACCAALERLKPIFENHIWNIVADEDAEAVMNWLIDFAINKPALEIAACATEDVMRNSRHNNGGVGSDFLLINPQNNNNNNGNRIISPHAAWWLYKQEKDGDAAASALCRIVSTTTSLPLSTRVFLAECALEAANSDCFKMKENLPYVHALQQHVLAQDSLLKTLIAVDDVYVYSTTSAGSSSRGGINSASSPNTPVVANDDDASHHHQNSNNNNHHDFLLLASDLMESVRSFIAELENTNGNLYSLVMLREWCGHHHRVPGVGECELQVLKARVSMMSAIAIIRERMMMNNDDTNNNDNNNFFGGNIQENQQLLLSDEQERYLNISAWCGAFEAAVTNPLHLYVGVATVPSFTLLSSAKMTMMNSHGVSPVNKDDSHHQLNFPRNTSSSVTNDRVVGRYQQQSSNELISRAVEIIASLGRVHGVSLPFLVSFIEAASEIALPSSAGVGHSSSSIGQRIGTSPTTTGSSGFNYTQQSVRCKAYLSMGITAPILIPAFLQICDVLSNTSLPSSGNLNNSNNGNNSLQQFGSFPAAASSSNNNVLARDNSDLQQQQQQHHHGSSSLSEAFARTRISAAELLLRAARYFNELPDKDSENMRRAFGALDARVKKLFANARTGSRYVFSQADRSNLEEANRVLLQNESTLMELDTCGRSRSFIF